MRPNISVKIRRPATTATFKASTAGQNCILASHPSHACSEPVRSRKSSVIRVKVTAASKILIFLSMVYRYCFQIIIVSFR